MFAKQVWSFLRPRDRASPLKMYGDVSYHYDRNLVEQGKIDVSHVVSENQHADILTKSLGREVFEGHRKYILNRDDGVHRSSRRNDVR